MGKNLPPLYLSACCIYQEQFINTGETEEKLISFQLNHTWENYKLI